MSITDLKNLIAIYMGRTTVNDLVLNGFDTGLYALNAARRVAERAHDFKYSEANAYLSIPSIGADLTSAYVNQNVTVTGTLSPNVAGTFALSGTYNGLPFYTITVSTVVYFLSYSGTAWTVTTGGFTAGSNYWSLTTASTNPSGAYTPHGSNTGALTAAIAIAAIGVKRVKYVLLPIAGGDYQPVEFLSNDQFLNRVRMQVGRQNFNTAKTLATLGSTLLGNPLAYQNAQTIYLAPSNLTFPQVTQLNIVRWMPDYTTGTDTDFFTLYGPEFLQWQGILECNKFWKRFTERQEGNVDEAAVQQMAEAALQTLIAWDSGINSGTTDRSPISQPQAA